MDITLFGSCRIDGISNNNDLNNLINYTHSTKEVIQLINFLNGYITLQSPLNILCFRTGIINDKPIEYNNIFTEKFNKSNLCVVEICSDKIYKYDNYFLHHLSVDKRLNWWNNTPSIVFENYKCIKQSNDEIENDILEIQKLIYPRKLILVTHYNSKLNGNYIPSRNNLINLLIMISNKYNIPLINPEIVLSEYEQYKVMDDDLGHYTEFGKNIMINFINNFISNL